MTLLLNGNKKDNINVDKYKHYIVLRVVFYCPQFHFQSISFVTPHSPTRTHPHSEYDRQVRQSGLQGATLVADVSVFRHRSCDGS